MEKLKKKGLRIQYFSDLHLELKRTVLPVVPVLGDVLVLGGDMGDIDDGKFPTFMGQMSKDFKDVVIITGNREYYQWSKTKQMSMIQLEERIEKYHSQFPNVHFLNKSTWTHPSGLDFHGCTLWCHIPTASASLTEKKVFTYKYAYTAPGKKVTVADTNKIHEDHVTWLKSAISKSKQCVVVTHHTPTLRFYKSPDLAVVGGLGANLDKLIETSPQIKLWICGHAHFIADVVIGSTLCSMNCIGYPGDSPIVYFDKTFDISI